MADTIHVRGEGGAVIAMDLPLPEAIQQRLDRGLIQRVDADGTSLGVPASVSAEEPSDRADEQQAAAPAADRPALAAPKADWITHVVRRGLLSAEDAANYTKADLIDMAG
ncbi:hypothetical protein OG393_20990 [Streptomyces sp. NBC_01216]|uniref:hypothetical protein n=1 Tax=Streptomyces sp. NBC_01216 TaxID=2903778 RepID=UPI002E1645FC|nr:hypothetical protein OG393_20990 [Streptomyces sp. NBC_01216]